MDRFFSQILTQIIINSFSCSPLNSAFLISNKRALGPWVAHLRKTVYKGVGEHSSSQSPAMSFDRSAISLRLTKAYADKTNRM